ncbi:FtsK/SpoIIIE domain-containing protein [Microbacterium sp.]|uniref:FtsK/SpoIIIE domain-containing protein n=1 Tax=Microbacterium sp. TaxID=51671 RepID=UPI0039E6F5B2
MRNRPAADLDPAELDPAEWDSGEFDEPLRMPAAPAATPRPPVPMLAAIVPVAGAVVLWQLTGSVYALWFAALGPLLAAAGFIDGLRGVRRAARRARREAATQLEGVAAGVERHHAAQRRRAWATTPDVAGYDADPAEIWRRVPGREEVVVVGRGVGTSTVRLEGEPHDEPSRDLRRRARRLDDVPVTVPLHAGIAVCGPPALTAPVVRALALQVCLAHPPGEVRVTLGAGGPGVPALPPLPHQDSTQGDVLFVGSATHPLPAEADIPIVQVTGTAPPPRCAAVLTVTAAGTARLDHAGTSREVRTEAVSTQQAHAAAAVLSARAAALGQRPDDTVAADDLALPGAGVLAASVGVSGGETVVLDLVADGPHAVVIGVTGSGKSELLTTWAVGMCRGRSVDEVSLLLVDFKGGRTFDPLLVLPHVVGVLTDLDDAQALRAVESLRAEVRHRERVLAAHGARELAEAPGVLPRLVVVVDEYAALVTAHPGLHELFADIAARGRALGMHLILASQRAAGSFRDAVLANAPLRIAFRVTDAADSRAVLGSDDAAQLPGHAAARGTALVRRAADGGARRMRVALCAPTAIAAVARAAEACAADTRAAETGAVETDGAGPRRARAPWLPPLPPVVPLSALGALGAPAAGGVLLGLVDEPEQQRQVALELPAGAAGFAVIGGAGSGRTTLLRAVAAQRPHVWVPGDAEGAWDAVAALEDAPAGTAVLVDDADAIAARLPGDYAAEWLARLERAAREARGRGTLVVVSAARAAGPLARTLDLLGHRAILAVASRADHVAAGGEAADHVADTPPGRGRWGRRPVQFAHVPAVAAPAPAAPRPWLPGRTTVALVLPPGPAAGRVPAACRAAGAHVIGVEEATASLAPSAALPPATVVHGTPEAWLAAWRLLAAARGAAEFVVAAECAPEYRQVTGRRDLPPYARPGAGRGWRITAAGEVERALLPAA